VSWRASRATAERGNALLTGADLTAGRSWTGAPRRLTRTDFVRYAGASGDFNPMHHDEVSARAGGEPSVFGHGMFSAGLLATELTELVGLPALRSYKVRFTRQVRPAEVVTGVFTVRGVVPDGTTGTVLVDLDCVLGADAGDVVRGTAQVQVRA
jgi:acyl dehydratase